MAASEDRARRRQERRAGAAGEARAHDRARPADEGQRTKGAAPEPQPVAKPPKGNFVRESADELKKVEWPGQAQVIQATTVVLVACIIVGFWLYANDFIWQRVVKDFLLK